MAQNPYIKPKRPFFYILWGPGSYYLTVVFIYPKVGVCFIALPWGSNPINNAYIGP